MDRFEGHIAGIGTASGTRLVVGRWDRSPFGAFTDVMMEDAAGVRTLIAPSEDIASYVGATYSFDEVEVAPVRSSLSATHLMVRAGGLQVTATLGGRTVLGRALALVPRAVATSPRWLTVISPLAAALVPGVRTAGSAGNGRREYYGVHSARSVTAATATLNGTGLGPLAPLRPAVRFGFSSAPAAPQIVSVVTTISRPR
ncbi:hypothetical protein ACX80W_07775 [Arthrobacter sp. TMN-37]